MRHATGQGAYITPAGIGINTNNVARCLPGMYDIPKIDFRPNACSPTPRRWGPYRGAGRPEANYALDRVVEEAARITGIDTAKLRKKRSIRKSAMPYKTAVTTTYDSGDFPTIYARAMEMAEFDGFNKRKRESGAQREAARDRHFLHAGARRRAADRRRAVQFPGGES